MTEKFYDVYFDPFYLKVDRDGELINPEDLHIIELQYDEAEDRIVSAHRIDENGNDLGEDSEIMDQFHVGYGDCETIRDALDQFEKWLEYHLVWDDETCLGIEGYTDAEKEQ